MILSSFYGGVTTKKLIEDSTAVGVSHFILQFSMANIGPFIQKSGAGLTLKNWPAGRIPHKTPGV